MKKTNVSNLILGTALISAAAYAVYKMYSKNKKSKEETTYERKYTLLTSIPLPKSSDEFEETDVKVM